MNKTLILLLLVFLLQACGKKENDLAFEQKVLDQVFEDVVNLTYKDKRIYTFDCKEGKRIFEKGTYLGWNKPECDKQIKALERDTLNLIIAINDFTKPISSTDNESIPPGFTILNPKPFKIKLDTYHSSKFTFKYISELTTNHNLDNWSTKYPKFIGTLKISKIYFDAKREKGVLTVSYNCGAKCGLDYIVYLQQTNRKWQVEKKKLTGIY